VADINDLRDIGIDLPSLLPLQPPPQTPEQIIPYIQALHNYLSDDRAKVVRAINVIARYRNIVTTESTALTMVAQDSKAQRINENKRTLEFDSAIPTGSAEWVPIVTTGYVQSTDPGAVGAGMLWIDTSDGTGLWKLRVRNAADTGWESVNLDGPLIVGDAGLNSSRVLIDPANGIFLYGTATMWDDLRVSADTTKLAGSKDPGYAVFKTDGAVSQGVFLYWFSDSTEEEVYFSVQLPHAWAEGTDIKPHVHWVAASTAVAAGTDACWGLEYTWANINGTFGNTALIYGDEQTNGATETITAGKHYITALPTISGSGKTMSSMLICRLFRSVSPPIPGYTDDLVGDAGLLEIDFHIQINSLGSDDEYVKGP
jgi:hypothetical protein